ncbi:hypothetical protein ABGA94_20515, partial [Stenotrophomonas sp. 3diitr2024]
TSLLTHPALYLQRDRPTLLVSFGRSGSSPESVAAVERVRESKRKPRAPKPDAAEMDFEEPSEDEIASRINGLQQPLENCSRLIHKLLIRLNF